MTNAPKRTSTDSPSQPRRIQHDADGSVAAGVAALSAFEAGISPEIIRRFSREVKQAPLVILDGNLPTEILQVMK